MRLACLAALLVGVGCRAVPETAAGFRDREIASSAEPFSAATNVNVEATHSDIVLTAFSTESKRQDSENNESGKDSENSKDSGDSLLPGQQRPPSKDNSASQVMSELPAVPLSTVPLSLTLEAAVQTALARNPDLIAIRSGESVGHAAYHVAKTYPFNPQFQTQVLPYTRDRYGNDAPVSSQHVIVQTFELAGQSRFRSGAAAASWEQVRRTIQQSELLTIAQAERLYFTALYQRELRETNQMLVTLNDKMLGVMKRRLKAGQANSADVALTRLQVQSARRQQQLLEANYQTALMILLNYLDLVEDAEVELTGRWLGGQWRSLADVLSDIDHGAPDGQVPGISTAEADGAWGPTVRQLVAERPDVKAARAGVTMARENLALAEAMRTPNLQIGPMWQRDNSATQFWGVQGQINIPVVNTGEPLVRQRRAEVQQQQVTATRLEQKARLEARAAIRRYERARRFVEQSRGEFAQSMSDVLKPFENQFQAGQITLLQVFAARTSFVQSRQSFLALLNELALAAADVTQATGLPALQLITDPPSESKETETVPVP